MAVLPSFRPTPGRCGYCWRDAVPKLRPVCGFCREKTDFDTCQGCAKKIENGDECAKQLESRFYTSSAPSLD